MPAVTSAAMYAAAAIYGRRFAHISAPVTAVGTTFVQFLPIADVGGLLAIRASNGVQLTCN